MDITTAYYVVIGVAAGTLGSMLGLGGGIIMIPALTILLDVNIKSAISASLISLVATSVMSVSVFARQGLVNYRMGLLFVATTIVGSFLGSVTGVFVNERFLLTAFSILLLTGALGMIRRGSSDPEAAIHPEQETNRSRLVIDGTFTNPSGQTIRYRVHHPFWGTALSTMAGWISGLLGVGGGIVQVPLMKSVCRVPIKVATATSSFMIGFTGLAGALVYFLYEGVDLIMTSALVIGIVAGSQLGSRFAVYLSSRALVILFVVTLLISAVRLLAKAWGPL